MITVTAAILEKNGRILAARKRAGLHLGGYWEFPGGKIEPGETPEECLQRELEEEFGVICNIGEFLTESVYEYGNKTIRLLGYFAHHVSGEFKLSDHDTIEWRPVIDLVKLDWAPADIPLVEALTAKYFTEQTLNYYNANGASYIQETIDQDMVKIRTLFCSHLEYGAHILDLGCGSGRDSKAFLQLGYAITAIDPSPTIARITSHFLDQKVLIKTAQEINEQNLYDGIWACASLLHIPESELAQTLTKLVDALKPHGVLYISCKKDIERPLDERGRYNNSISLEKLAGHFAATPGIHIIDHFETASTFHMVPDRWLNVLVKKKQYGKQP